MAYNSNKGPQHSGDIQYEGDPNDVQIDFENDQIILRTGGAPRVNLTNTALSASGLFHNVGVATLGNVLNITGGVGIGSVLPTNSAAQLKVAGVISGSGITRLTTLSASADVYVSGAVKATKFFGDGSSLTGIAGAASGSVRLYSSTGVETSGYLKVSGSSTLNAVTLTTLSGSGLAQLTSISASADLVASGSVIVGENKYIGIPGRNMIEVKDGSIVVMGLLRADNAVSSSNLILGTSLTSSGDCAVTGNVHATAYYGDGSNLTGIGSSAFSGSARHYSTTGFETSGYLKVSGSSTLGGLVTAAGGFASISGSGVTRLATVSASADVYVTGAVKAALFFGDGSNLTGISGGSASGSARVYSGTGLETSGYLKVSGSSTLNGVTATTYSGSSTMQVVGATILGGNLNVSGSTVMEGLTANGITNVGVYSGSNTLQNVGNAFFGGTVNASGSIKLQVNEPAIYFSNSAGNVLGEIGFNSSNNILIQNNFTNKHIVFKANDNGTLREGFRIDGAVPEVVVNQGSDSLLDFRVESDSNQHMFFVDGSTNKIGVNNNAPAEVFSVVGNISGSAIARVATISASSDVYVSGAVKATTYYGDGSNLTGIGGGSVSGSSRVYSSTGVETSGYLKVSGSATLAGTLRSAGYTHITHHAYSNTGTAAVFIPFAGETESGNPSFRNQMIAPLPGRLLKAFVRSKGAQGGSVTLKLFKAADGTEDFNGAGTEVEAVTVTMTDANTTYTFALSGAAPQYSAGEIIGVEVNPNTNGQDYNVTCLWEYNDIGV
jgi:hypothetical protein